MKENRDFIWECDYGERSKYIEILKTILEEQNADELGMCALYVNNNPYNLEFFIVLAYEKPKDGQVERSICLMGKAGARQRPDIPMSELFQELGKKRFNSMTVIDPVTIGMAMESLFQFKEKSQLASIVSMKPLGKSLPVFLSHSSADKLFIEDLIPYLSYRGLSVWYDKISIDYGESITSAVQEGIKESGAVIFYITLNFLNSSWCKLEMESFLSRYASGHNVLLLTVVSEEVTVDNLPLFLRNVKYLKLESDKTPETVANELFPVLVKHFHL